MKTKKLIAVIAACTLLSGCGNEVVNELAGYLKKPAPTASASGSAPSASQAAVVAANAQASSGAETDANPFPWTKDANGNYPNGIIGRIVVLKDGMEIHQWGGVASAVVGTARANEEYLVSNEFMDSSGNKWYCVGSEMWLRVTNMSDVDYRSIELSRTPDPNLETYTNDSSGEENGTDGGDSAPLTDGTQAQDGTTDSSTSDQGTQQDAQEQEEDQNG